MNPAHCGVWACIVRCMMVFGAARTLSSDVFRPVLDFQSISFGLGEDRGLFSFLGSVLVVLLPA